jgi:D-alanine-D-alanine ligase
MGRHRLHVALIYNACRDAAPEAPDDRASTDDLRAFIRQLARVLRRLRHRVTVIPLANDLMAFQRRLTRLRPDVVFNQYDDVVHGALYEMRVAALVRMMGFPMTGSSALALGLCRFKHMSISLLQGAGLAVPPDSRLLERIGDAGRHRWRFPLIVHPAQEHAGIGLTRESVVRSATALRGQVRRILREYGQAALVQRFLPGREFNIGLLGGRRLRVLPFAEVNYAKLPADIPPIMSYAAKWLESTVEYRKISVVCPARVPPALERRIARLAVDAFRAVGGWGYGRVDIRLDENDRPHVLEVNCNPCLEEEVALARSALAAGIAYPRLLQAILDAALERRPFDVDVPMLPPPAARRGILPLPILAPT